MSRTGLWVLTVVLFPIAGFMGLVTYIELHAGRDLSFAFYVILAAVWYFYLLLFFAAATREGSLPNHVLMYPWQMIGKGLSAIHPKFYSSTIIFGVFVLLIYWAVWMPVEYIVLVENFICKNGGAKPTTLWSGIITLFIGYMSLNHVLYGKAYIFYPVQEDDLLSKKSIQLRKKIKGIVILIAVGLSAMALYRLGSLSLFTTTGKSIVTVTGSVLVYVVALAIIFFIIFLFSGLKQKRINKKVIQDLALISLSEREDIVISIDKAARTSDYALMHSCFVTPSYESTLSVISHFGGVPYLENINEFPIMGETTNHQTEFLLQLKLSAPRLGHTWQGQLITVYLDEYGGEITIRSYTDPAIEKQVTLTDYKESYAPLTFKSLAIPYVPEPVEYEDDSEIDDEHIPGYETESLIRHTSGLKEKLQQYTQYESILLSRLIDPQLEHELDISNVILEGGDPVIIQSSHEAHCPVCDKKMRFLFQFGEVSKELQIGDCGQIYVYGCDDHTEQFEGFIDFY